MDRPKTKGKQPYYEDTPDFPPKKSPSPQAKGKLVPDDSSEEYEKYKTESEVEESGQPIQFKGNFEVVKGASGL